MPRAEEVNPGNFEVERVIYDDGVFSVVWGTYVPNASRCVGMRWNETGTSNLGHPSVRGNPMWFVLPDVVAVGALRNLAELPETRTEALIATLRDLCEEESSE